MWILEECLGFGGSYSSGGGREQLIAGMESELERGCGLWRDTFEAATCRGRKVASCSGAVVQGRSGVGDKLRGVAALSS